MNTRKRTVLLSLYFGLPSIVILTALLYDPSIAADPALLTAFVAGVLGYSWLMLQLLLSARLKWIEKGIGLDRLLVFHRTMAPVSLVLLLSHVLVKFLYYPLSLQKLSGTLAYIGFLLAGVAAMILMGSAGKSGIGKAIRSFVYQRLNRQYQDVKAVHNLTFLLAVIMFFHVISSSLAQYTPLLKIYFIALFLIGAASYGYHKFIRPARFDPVYRVEELDQPADHITSIRFSLEKGRAVQHLPGQFAFFRFLDKFPGPEEHPFTISDMETPGITVKALGDFTSALPNVKVGSLVKINGPYGVFSYRFLRREVPLVFIAGGIGITPFLSMCRGLQMDGDTRRPLLLWNVSRQKDFVHLEELSARCRMEQIVEYPDGTWTGHKGRLDRAVLEELVPTDLLSSAVFFLCGPPPMMKSLRKSLADLGVTRSRLRWERFSL